MQISDVLSVVETATLYPGVHRQLPLSGRKKHYFISRYFVHERKKVFYLQKSSVVNAMPYLH